jgi:hypothetical protein
MHRFAIRTAFAVTLSLLVATSPAEAGCGDYNQDGNVSSTDALGVLGAAVQTLSCAKVRCDVDDSGSVGATDALLVLKRSVGQALTLSCPAVAVSSIGDLPLATGPVRDGSSLGALVAGLGGQTPSGIDLRSLGADTFDSQSSRAACEISNMVASAVDDAAQGDRILCYVQNVFHNNPDVGVDIYDGNYHVFALDFGAQAPGGNPEESGGPSSVKMRIVRDGSTISDFEMFVCESGPNGPVQGEYIRQTIDGPDFRMLTKGMRSEEGRENSRVIEVSGGFDDDGQFTGTKVVDVGHIYEETEFSSFGELSFGQGAERFSVDGFDSHTFSSLEYGSGSFSRAVRAEAALLDFNVDGEPYDIGLLAIGDGAARARSTGSNDSGSWDDDFVEGWNGDTTRPDADAAAEFIDLVSDAELVDPSATPVIAYNEGETFDCATAPEATVVVNQEVLDVVCSHLEIHNDWVPCHELIEAPQGGCEGESCPCEGPDCPPCEGPDCPSCEGPDCPCEGPDCGGPECFDPECTCDPFLDDGCLESCWNYEECGEPCWDTSCTCSPEEPGCVEECWDTPRCGEPCFDEECGPK